MTTPNTAPTCTHGLSFNCATCWPVSLVPRKPWRVVDPRDGNRVMGHYMSRSRAALARDRLDNQYGAYRYRVEPTT